MKLFQLMVCGLVFFTVFPSARATSICDQASKLANFDSQANVFFLDTNILLTEPGAFLAFKKGETVVIPQQVLIELEKKKTNPELGMAAREFFRLFDSHTGNQLLRGGITLNNGSKLLIQRLAPVNGRSSADLRSLDLTPGSNPDNVILGSMIQYRNQNPDARIMFLSNDNAFRIQARVFDFNVGRYNEQYNSVLPVTDEELVYSGLKKNFLRQDDLEYFQGNQGVFKVQNPAGFYDNQFVLIREQEVEKINPALELTPENTRVVVEPLVARYRGSDQSLVKLNIKMSSVIENISPQNLEQRMGLELLMDPSITTVTLFGKAGSGKTLISMAAALQQKRKKVYNQILYAKSYEKVGGEDKVGFLKGSYDDKTGPFHESFLDNLETIYGFEKVSAAKKRLNNQTNEILREFGMDNVNILYSRGRSIVNSIIIIDEAQNLTAAELKTLGTRVGKGSKLILIGDLKQIDLAGVRGASGSAFYKVVNSEAFKRSDLSGHIMLLGGLRSKTADLFSDIFDEIEGVIKK
jgi:PhoH-like ATPase